MNNTLPPPATPTMTSINLIIARSENRKYNTLVNAGNDYYSDGIPVELYCKILKAVDSVVKDWNNKHK